LISSDKENLKMFHKDDIFKIEQSKLKILNLLDRHKIKILDKDNSKYFDKLKEIYKPPNVLYYKGNVLNKDKKMVAIVGAREATRYGLETAYNIAYELAKRDVIIVSGMAKGIDSFAHAGALKAGGETIAVLGNGLDVVYPKENKKLMDEIECKGMLISEYFLGEKPLKYHFPQRNRIISGISDFVLVVEAKEKSGSLITARLALDDGKDVGSVPGNIYSDYSKGTNELIRDGAYVVTSYEDVIELLR